MKTFEFAFYDPLALLKQNSFKDPKSVYHGLAPIEGLGIQLNNTDSRISVTGVHHNKGVGFGSVILSFDATAVSFGPDEVQS